MELLMQKYVHFIFVFFLAALLTACGSSSSSSTTAVTAVYNLPTPVSVDLTNLSRRMGGAVQGTELVITNTVESFSGSAGSGSSIDGSATEATYNHPIGITTDGTDFYIADYTNSSIRKVTSSGAVTTMEFTDASTETVSGFYLPTDIAIKPDGSQLYVVSSSSNRISIIDLPANTVTTIGSTEGLSGSVDTADDVDPAANAGVARFNQPTGITTDGTSLYITDSGNHTIRRIDIATKAVSTLAGTSGSVGTTDGIQAVARFKFPARITTDGVNLYVTDFNDRTIRKIDIASGLVSTLAGTPGDLGADSGTLDSTDGTGATARFNRPNGITTDGTNLYVTDSENNTIRKIDSVSGNTSTLPLPAGSLHSPIGITTNGSSLYVADYLTVVPDDDPNKITYTYIYSNSILRIY